MKTATELNRKLSGSGAQQRHYKLSEPMEWKDWENDQQCTTDYVIVSSVVAFDTGQPETFIFPSDESGKVTDFRELDGSQRGTLDHEKALVNAGYEVVVETS